MLLTLQSTREPSQVLLKTQTPQASLPGLISYARVGPGESAYLLSSLGASRASVPETTLNNNTKWSKMQVQELDKPGSKF